VEDILTMSQRELKRLHLIRKAIDRRIKQREADFLVSVEGKPWFCVEVKTSPKDISPHLAYFSKKLKIPFSYQVVRQKGVDFIKDNIRIISASKFFTSLV